MWLYVLTGKLRSIKCPERLYLNHGVTIIQHRIGTCIDEHYPIFIATTRSCARPSALSQPRLLALYQESLQLAVSSLLDPGPSRRYLCESFPRCLDPYPGGSFGAFTRFFPKNIGLHRLGSGSALNNSRTTTSVRSSFRGCNHSLMFRPPGLLATQVVPTATVLCLSGSRGFYFHAYLGLLPHRAVDMLAVRIE